ncbi:MAG: universal stress protein [Gammaproteobacteria bacterium]|nr:universal stress protein [Gammaproteobacteria bacterium]MCW8993401.1 universal stress protein [Gammaproteobacteria bacterium]
MKHFQSILYVSETSVEQDSALARAVSLAENNQAALTVIDVIPPLSAGIRLPHGGPISADLQALAVSEHRQALEALVAPYRTRLSIQVDVLVGLTFLETIRAVIRNAHDLVIKPAENPDFVERLFGGDDMHLLRKCPCPVWLMKPGEKSNYQRILAAVDFDPEMPSAPEQGPNSEILELAASLAVSDFAELHLVHAWDTPAEMLLRSWSDNPEEAVLHYVETERLRHKRGMDAIKSMLQERLGKEAYEYISPRYHLTQGVAKQVIPQTAERVGADLVVMGTLARTGVRGLFIGNTAETILEQLRCSVLAFKPPGFVSPVTVSK